MNLGLTSYLAIGFLIAIMLTIYLIYHYAAKRTKIYVYVLVSFSIALSLFSCIIIPLDIYTVTIFVIRNLMALIQMNKKKITIF